MILGWEKHNKINGYYNLQTLKKSSGLNLQVAGTLINSELPWNPAKKNQRIGSIDRLGQKSNKLTIFNLLPRQKILSYQIRL
jgi:SNF2 family DNA or RNA helicase